MKTLKYFVLAAVFFLLLSGITWAGTPVYCNDGGSNTSPYETWAKAATTMATALTAVDAGGTIYVQSNHAEEFVADTTLSSTNGITATPVTIISVTNTNEPPEAGDYQTMTAGGGKLDALTNGAYDIRLGGWDIWIGMEFITGDKLYVTDADTDVFLYNCKLKVTTDTTVGTGGDAAATLVNCDIEQLGVGSIKTAGRFFWLGGSFTFNGGTISNNLVTPSTGYGSGVVIADVDIQDLDASDYLVDDANTHCNILFKRCKIPAAVFDNDNFMAGGPTGGCGNIRFHSVTDNDNIYAFREYYFEGNIASDVATYLDATYDGSNGYSVKMVSDATNATIWTRPLRFKLAEIYVSATNQDIRVELLTTDGAVAETLHTNDFWIEVEYPDSTTAALGNILSTRTANILIAGTTELIASANDGGDWTGELANNNFYKSVADFTTVADEAVGIYTVWACLAIPDTTVYVDPKVTVE